MNDVALVPDPLNTGELIVQHDAKALTTPEEGVEFVRYFQKAVASCKAIGADRAKTNKYAEQLVRHVRETGRLIERLPRSKGGRGKTDPSGWASFIDRTGVKPSTAQNWQALVTRITDEVFDGRIEALKADDEAIIALSEFYKLFKIEKKRHRVADLDAQADAILANPPQLAEVVADVVVIDPPWPYGTQYDPEGRRAANPYPEMSLAEIEQDVRQRVTFADDCILWLWTTHQFMRHSFPLLDAWGFQEKAITTWVKDRMGLGAWLRSQSEFCIMAVRGNPVVTLTNQTTVLNGAQREHSRKPDEFYAMVDTLCHGTKVDFYSREPREGWFQFGNDTRKFA